MTIALEPAEDFPLDFNNSMNTNFKLNYYEKHFKIFNDCNTIIVNSKLQTYL
jgi:hypothetical protein